MILTYLIKSALCLLVLLIFYKIGLENKSMHQFKRFYLLTGLVFAFTIPLVTFTYTIEVPVQPSVQTYNITQPILLEEPLILKEEINYWPIILWSIYGIGALILGIRFILNLVRLKRKIDEAQHLVENDLTLALLSKPIVPHSFLKWIFLNRIQYLEHKIAPEVIAHEATHVRQKHSWDILIIEVLQVIFWFNPLIWFSKSLIKLNHEFLADQGAIDNKCNIAIYQNILLSYASSTHHTTLESPFNYSLTKKRITMLSQSFSRKRAILSTLLVIPVLVFCALFFNNEIKAQSEFKELEEIHSIVGHWIDHADENINVVIYMKDDTLWWDQFVQKIPIEIEANEYYLPSGEERLKLSIAANGFLKLGDSVYFTSPEDTISYRIDGVWQAQKGDTQYLFNTKNGDPTCDVNDLGTGKSTRYYPKLIDNGMTFTMGETWVRFELKGNKLQMQNGTLLSRKINNSTYNLEEDQHENYATQFILGAQRNGKNAIVIEVKNDSIYINGGYVELDKLGERIDNVTANWTKEDYADPIRSIIFKGNSPEFIDKAELAFKKTNMYKANNNARLIPPPPPAAMPPKMPPPPPPPVSPSKHLKKMKSLGGLFFYENTLIAYEKAVKIVKENPILNITTPYPYSNPPKTTISRQRP